MKKINLDSPEKKSLMLQIRVDASLYEALTALAKKHKVKPVKIARYILEKSINDFE